MRTRIKFNQGWHFAKTEEIPEEFPDRWENIMLPHTWNAVDGQDGGNDYYRGTCMYVKKFRKPKMEADSHAVLEFCGAAMVAKVYINGKEVKMHAGGYSIFRTDITEELSEENILCVSVDNSYHNTIYPQMADFTFYGGIYREVNLIVLSADHFELIKDGTPGIKVTPVVTFTETGNQTEVTCEAWVNGSGSVRFLVDETEHEKIVPVKDGYAVCSFILMDAHLWDGIHDPYLYTLRAELLTDARKPADSLSMRFGCRKFELDPQEGFLLNGRKYPLRGVSRHQDREGAGNALTMEMHCEDMALIREMGANSIRLAHYQHAQEFYDLCDEEGMIVWAEIPFISAFMKNGKENTLSQMRELITQCCHHPSIYCWGLSNEITAANAVTEELIENHRELEELCHKMDPTRPTAMAHISTLDMDSQLIRIADLGAYNLYFGWYKGKLTDNEAFLDEYHRRYPYRCIGFSEYGADANIQFQNAEPEAGDYSEGYQSIFHEHAVKIIMERPWLFGTYVWNMFDFAADGRDEGGTHGLNQKGLVTFDRKIKKDAFYLYKAYWSREPFVHLCGSRYADRPEEITEIKVYSNQPVVTLYVDGIETETKKADRVFKFQVSISGEHKIQAKSGNLSDEIKIRKVSEKNPSYVLKKETVMDWFERLGINPNYYSVNDTINNILENSKAAAVLDQMLGEGAPEGNALPISENAGLRKMIGRMTVADVLRRGGSAAGSLEKINEALQKIVK